MPSFGLLTCRYGSHLSNAKDLRSFAQKLAKLEQFLFGPLDFSEILDFQRKPFLRILAVILKFVPRPQFLGPGPNFFFICHVNTHILGINHCFGHYPNFWGPAVRNSNLR